MTCRGRVSLAAGMAALLAPMALAETVSQQEILRRLERLEAQQREYRDELQRKDRRIEELERQLQRQQTTVSSETVTPLRQPPAPPAVAVAPVRKPAREHYGDFSPGRGFQIADTEHGTLNFSLYTLLRYLNQDGLDDTYTDAFGRTRDIDQRNDFQVQKAMLYFKGWVFDPDLSYVFYTWTSNTSQGDGAQVVVAGYLSYRISDALNVAAGISGLPSTRTLEGSWPFFLKADYRTIADEYFRGSYTSGFFASGEPVRGLQYKVMLGNNLSQLGVNGAQMDDTFDTFAGALWWMPTTGEYGPGQGFGDYEHHDRLATRIGLHYTHSTEDKQSQPGAEDPENTQIRLSDGTAIFDIGAFMPGTQVEEARYQMVSLDAGFKYRGFALEGEYFWRWVDRLRATGPLPVDDLFDHGFQLQVSAMLLPKRLQLYVAGSKIRGEYGDPYDVALGTNWWPQHDNRRLRLNAELLYLYDSPVGYSSVPFALGGHGTVFNTNLEFSF